MKKDALHYLDNSYLFARMRAYYADNKRLPDATQFQAWLDEMPDDEKQTPYLGIELNRGATHDTD